MKTLTLDELIEQLHGLRQQLGGGVLIEFASGG